MSAAAAPDSPSWWRRPGRISLPGLALVLGCAGWEILVRAFDVPAWQLPAPSAILATLVQDREILFGSLMVTLETTALGFLLAVLGGAGLAILFGQSRLLEDMLYPYAVILQVTPVVAIAPILLIWLPQPVAVLACAWIVAFFPMLANTTLGLHSVDHNLDDLFTLYGASRLERLLRLQLPAALPLMLAGARIAGGLSLIGAVVAEIAAGSAGAGSGLAYRIAEAGYRLDVPRMFAALILLSAAGIAVYAVLSLVSWLVLRRWHESALARGP
ncbi:ABC transporter permease [Rhodoplanes sp. TEM]|uniref:ABC transporter permease n=1 Tax=Rhodoplanes TaxID=29407 RepID=UPI002350E6E0|nr:MULTISPECIES: ABC transporter permease [Rhodoplanes]MDC7987685.1 ABC transporter permease [Rhodoplanes sp. TEM]MDQ0359036.1 NitT/TauT family transport system permease protein [Rhodoplanes tepidamans]